MREVNVPQSTDSAPGVAVSVDGLPDSSRSFPIAEEEKEEVRGSRGRYAKLLIPLSIGTAVLIGPDNRCNTRSA